MLILISVGRSLYSIVQHTEVVNGGVVKGEAVHIREASTGADTFRDIEDIKDTCDQSASLEEEGREGGGRGRGREERREGRGGRV